jgi:hypothetical protein
MSKNLKKEIENLAEIVRCHPNGIAIEELLKFMNHVTPKRTVQHRLSTLIKSGILRIEGAGRNTKYYFNQVAENKQTLKLSKATETTFKIPLSPEAEEVRKQISVPIQLRQHVSYRREFLDSYEPNKTFYLSQSIIEKLFKLGAGAEKGHPAGTYARKIYQRLLIDLSWNSSRLEGNTYSLLETERFLATGEEAPGKNWIDTQMILKHKAAL